MDPTSSSLVGGFTLFIVLAYMASGVFVFGGAYLIWLGIRALRRHLREDVTEPAALSLQKTAYNAQQISDHLHGIRYELGLLRKMREDDRQVISGATPQASRPAAPSNASNHIAPPAVSTSMFGR